MSAAFKPLPEHVTALATFQRMHGRRWKDALQDRWYHGWRRGESLETYSGYLQQVRNTAGGIEWALSQKAPRS